MKTVTVHALIRQHILHGMPAHAYLLVGNDEASKDATINFIGEHFFGSLWSHNPDVIVLAPEEGKDSISLAAVREVRARLFQKPMGEGSHILCIIRSLDRIGREGSAALLKILEDPPAPMIFLATSTHREAILSTVRSRFLILRFWNGSKKESYELFEQFQKLSYEERLIKVTKFDGREALGEFVRFALSFYDQKLRETSDTARILTIMQRFVSVRTLLRDPTASERMIGEYCMAFF